MLGLRPAAGVPAPPQPAEFVPPRAKTQPVAPRAEILPSPPVDGPALATPQKPAPGTDDRSRIELLERRIERLEQRIRELERAVATPAK